MHIDQLQRKVLPQQVEDIITKQKKAHFSFWESGRGRRDFVGDEAIALYEAIAQTQEHATIELKGYVASLGKAIGRVRIIFNPHLDNLVFNEGEILVTGMTSPDFAPFMKKAGAIVTELGGVTCHAAIISRELRKPCVVGTKFATKMLKDGDLVEVDANNGIVKVLH